MPNINDIRVGGKSKRKLPPQFIEFNKIKEQVRKKHPSMSFKQVLIEAGKIYRSRK